MMFDLSFEASQEKRNGYTEMIPVASTKDVDVFHMDDITVFRVYLFSCVSSKRFTFVLHCHVIWTLAFSRPLAHVFQKHQCHPIWALGSVFPETPPGELSDCNLIPLLTYPKMQYV